MADINWVLIITKIPLLGWAINKVADEHVRRALEGASKTHEVTVKVLSESAVKHSQEAQFYKDEVNRVRVEERITFLKYTELLIDNTVRNTFDNIEKDYYLVPKDNKSPFSDLLGLSQGIGQGLASGGGFLPPSQK